MASANSSGVQRKLAKFGIALERNLYTALRKMATGHLGRMRNRMKAGAGGVQTRTGRLFDSFTYRIDRGGGLGGLKMRLFSAGVPHANLQEHGGTIRPKPPRKFLTIPLAPMKTAAGVTRSTAAALRLDKSRNTFVLRSDSGKLYIAEQRSVGRGKYKQNDIQFLFRLVPSVTVKGNLGWLATWRGAKEERDALIQQAVAASVAEASK